MIETIISIVLIYLFYYIWIVINFDKSGNAKRKLKGKNNQRKMPIEIQFFVSKHNIDLDKINYRNFLKLIGMVVAFNLAVIATIINYIESLWLQLLVGFILILIGILTSFSLLGNYLKKKGLTKDENNKRNRK